uniref:Reverse transcriptase zinc-binding domain-containing protein n=1 Tax=Cannabis sativa TaxID=3483 RepID=A0A803P654_CANSA
MRKEIQSWEGRFLSKAGKEFLIKTVEQSLPSYAMNVFLLPMDTYQEMEQLMCKFWWQASAKNNKGIHWKSWERLTIHKSKGGMGFRNLRDFNLSLLNLGGNPSFVWRSILEAQEVVREGVRCRIGDGSTVNILSDPWLPDSKNLKVSSTHPTLLNQTVSVLMSTRDVAWDVDLVHDLFNDWDANLILSIPLSSSRERDVRFCCLEKTGHFSVKSTYKLLQMQKEAEAQPNNSDFWNYIWKVDNYCPRCVPHPETPYYCLVECHFASSCWEHSGIKKNIQGLSSFTGWLEAMFKQVEKAKRNDIVVLCWALWKTRNELVWSDK